jgi:hypothetical protein
MYRYAALSVVSDGTVETTVLFSIGSTSTTTKSKPKMTFFLFRKDKRRAKEYGTCPLS